MEQKSFFIRIFLCTADDRITRRSINFRRYKLTFMYYLVNAYRPIKVQWIYRGLEVG